MQLRKDQSDMFDGQPSFTTNLLAGSALQGPNRVWRQDQRLAISDGPWSNPLTWLLARVLGPAMLLSIPLSGARQDFRPAQP
jgi:hypothetical protein